MVRTLADDTIKVKFVGDMSGLNDELRKAQDAISRLGQDLTLSSASASDNTTTGNSGGVMSVSMEADPELKKQITALIRRISNLTSAINKPPNNPSANTWGDDKDFERRRVYEQEQQEGIKTLNQRELALISSREKREQAQADRDAKFDKQKSERFARDETRQAAAFAAEEQRRQRRELREIAWQWRNATGRTRLKLPNDAIYAKKRNTSEEKNAMKNMNPDGKSRRKSELNLKRNGKRMRKNKKPSAIRFDAIHKP